MLSVYMLGSRQVHRMSKDTYTSARKRECLSIRVIHIMYMNLYIYGLMDGCVHDGGCMHACMYAMQCNAM